MRRRVKFLAILPVFLALGGPARSAEQWFTEYWGTLAIRIVVQSFTSTPGAWCDYGPDAVSIGVPWTIPGENVYYDQSADWRGSLLFTLYVDPTTGLPKSKDVGGVPVLLPPHSRIECDYSNTIIEAYTGALYYLPPGEAGASTLASMRIGASVWQVGPYHYPDQGRMWALQTWTDAAVDRLPLEMHVWWQGIPEGHWGAGWAYASSGSLGKYNVYTPGPVLPPAVSARGTGKFSCGSRMCDQAAFSIDLSGFPPQGGFTITDMGRRKTIVCTKVASITPSADRLQLTVSGTCTVNGVASSFTLIVTDGAPDTVNLTAGSYSAAGNVSVGGLEIE